MMKQRKGNFIKVEHVALPDYKPGATQAILFIRNMEVHRVTCRNDIQDSAPESTAIARLWHEFMQAVGKSISRRPQDPQPAQTEEKV